MEYEQNRERETRRKQSAQKRRKKRRQKAIRIFVSFILILLSVAIILSLTVFFPITTISVNGSTIYSNEQIIEASGITIGENAFMSGGINSDKKITKKLPYVKTATVKRNFSGEIEISVTDTTAEICYFSDGQYFLCDGDNKILEFISEVPEDLLEIRLSNKISGDTGDYIDFSSSEDRFLADKIFNAFKSYGIDVQIIDITDDLNIKLLVDNRLVLLFGTKSEFEGKTAHFVSMYKKMSKDVTGIITLSAWSTNKQEAYFKESNISGYFGSQENTEDLKDDNKQDVTSSSSKKLTTSSEQSSKLSSSTAQSTSKKQHTSSGVKQSSSSKNNKTSG